MSEMINFEEIPVKEMIRAALEARKKSIHALFPLSGGSGPSYKRTPNLHGVQC